MCATRPPARPALRNVQPLFAELAEGGFAVAHNGNLSNAMKLRRTLNRRGSIFQSTSDTEVIIHLVATSSCRNPLDRLTDALKQVEGAYSLVVLTDEGLIACRDPLGIRPLVMGKLGEATIFASETVALDVIGATFLRDVEPGELILVNDSGIRSFRPFEKAAPRPCIFEHVYFSRPDQHRRGRVGLRSPQGDRRRAVARGAGRGRLCRAGARQRRAGGDRLFARRAGIPFELGIIRSHYVGRTFIQPSQDVRHLGVKLKHNANSALVDGKSIVLVDDSIVRGTTSVKLVQMMRDAGAREVHMRIASPPTRHSCFYGVDTPERAKLLAAQMSVEQMRDYINADSLAFISIEGLYRALGDERDAARRSAATPASPAITRPC